MPPLPRLTRMTARCLAAAPPGSACRCRRTVRLLVVGPAILTRPAPGRGPWRVPVAGGTSPLPLARRLASGTAVQPSALRVAAALLDPADLARGGSGLLRAARAVRTGDDRPEFYGWSLLYQLPGDGDSGRVDPHDDFADLPAFYESPLEIADRQEFLARRGVPSRILALLTSRADFDVTADRPPRNRYCPHARWRRAGAAATFDW